MKIISIGLVIIGLISIGVRISIVFDALILSVVRNLFMRI